MVTGYFEHNSSQKQIKEVHKILEDKEIIPKNMKQTEKIEEYKYIGEHPEFYYYYVYEDNNSNKYMIDYRTLKNEEETKYFYVTIMKNLYKNKNIEMFNKDELDKYEYETNYYTYEDGTVSLKNKYTYQNLYIYKIYNKDKIEKVSVE